MTNRLELLPHDILEEIFSYLDLLDLLALRETNKANRESGYNYILKISKGDVALETLSILYSTNFDASKEEEIFKDLSSIFLCKYDQKSPELANAINQDIISLLLSNFFDNNDDIYLEKQLKEWLLTYLLVDVERSDEEICEEMIKGIRENMWFIAMGITVEKDKDIAKEIWSKFLLAREAIRKQDMKSQLSSYLPIFSNYVQATRPEFESDLKALAANVLKQLNICLPWHAENVYKNTADHEYLKANESSFYVLSEESIIAMIKVFRFLGSVQKVEKIARQYQTSARRFISFILNKYSKKQVYSDNYYEVRWILGEMLLNNEGKVRSKSFDIAKPDLKAAAKSKNGRIKRRAFEELYGCLVC